MARTRTFTEWQWESRGGDASEGMVWITEEDKISAGWKARKTQSGTGRIRSRKITITEHNWEIENVGVQ